jgi:hypothetical protein
MSPINCPHCGGDLPAELIIRAMRMHPAETMRSQTVTQTPEPSRGTLAFREEEDQEGGKRLFVVRQPKGAGQGEQ